MLIVTGAVSRSVSSLTARRHPVPLSVSPGSHQLVFHPAEAPTVARDAIGGSDARALSFAIGTGSWTVQSEQP